MCPILTTYTAIDARQGQEGDHAYPGDGYFMQPLKLAKPGFVAEQSASLGMVGAQQVLRTVIRRVIGRMDGAQLLSVCGSIGRFMR
jgi:hypothetical protein